jgi:hypothetical protein
MVSNSVNQGGAVNEHTLSEPGGAFAYNGRLYVADWGNHRVNIYDCSFFPTPTVTPTPLCSGGGTAGYQVIGASSASANSLIEASKIVLPVAVTAARIQVYLDGAAGNFVLGFYTDAAGAPGTRISASSPQPAVLGWNVVEIPDVVVGAGTYWLAFNADSSSTTFRYDSGVSGDESFASTTYDGTLPATYSGGTSGPWKLSMYLDTCPSGPVSPTSTYTPTLSPTPACPGAGSVGKNAIGGTDFANSGYLDASRYWVTGTANAVALNIYLTVAGNYNLSLYTDSGGGSPVPVSRIAQTGDQVGSVGWNKASVGAVPVSGYVWIAHQVQGSAKVAYDNVGAGDYYATFAYGSNPTVFPAGTPATYTWSMYFDTCPLPTPTPTFTRTHTITQTPTITTSFSATRTLTPTFSYTSTITPTDSHTRTATPSFSHSSTITPTDSHTQTVTPSPTHTSTITPTHSYTQTVTPTDSHTRTVTPSPSFTSTITPTDSHTRTATPTDSHTRTITATHSYTQTVTPSFSDTSTITPTDSHTRTVTPSFSDTSTITPTDSHTRTVTPSPSYTSTITMTHSNTQTVTPSYSHTSTVTPTNSHTRTMTPTYSQTPTITVTHSYTQTVTPSHTFTSTITPTDSHTRTATRTSSPTATFTTTATFTASSTATRSSTSTVSPNGTFTSTGSITPSSSSSPTPSDSPTFTVTPSSTQTATPSSSRTVTPSPSDTVTPSSTRTGSFTFTTTPSFTATRTQTPFISATGTSTWTGTPTASQTLTPSASFSSSPTFTDTPTNGPSPTITFTWSITDTPLPTGTAVVPAVLNQNIFRPGRGVPLDIAFRATQDGHVTVRVFNLAGEKVREPFTADIPAGQWEHCPWDGRNALGESVGAGVYLVSIQGAGINKIMKVVLLR